MTKQKKGIDQSPESVYEPLDWFVLRTPLLPIERYFSLTKLHEKTSNAPAGMLTDPKVAAALSIGNPNFFDALKRFDQDKEDAESEKLMGKLLRLLIRMSSRCTPMGMYAGLAIGTWEEKTDLSIGETGNRLHTRPDTEIVANLALTLEKTLLKDLQLVINPTAAIYANRVYVIEKAAVLNEEDVHGATIEATAEIETIMSLARTPIAYSSLINQLVDSSRIPRADLEMLVAKLVQITFLLTSLRPSNQVGAADRLNEILKTIPAARDVSERLDRFISGARQFDESIKSINGLAVDHAQQYSDLTATGQAIVATKSGVSLQTDMRLSLNGTSLNRSLLKDAGELVRLMIGLCRGPFALHVEYKSRFSERYGEREVPLLELVNPDVGLGLPSNMAAESWSASGSHQGNLTFLNELIHNAIRDGKLEVELEADALEHLLTPPETRQEARYPLSLDVMFNVIAESQEAVDAGNYMLVHSGVVIPGAGRMLGRFAYMLDTDALSKMEQLLYNESILQPDKLYADISSLPRMLRLGNVATIPILRPFHIATDSWPDPSHPSQPLALDDLVVGIRQGRFYLRSLCHKKEVIICSAHMTNTLFGTALSKFLHEISQDGAWIPSGFKWEVLEHSSFLPRIRYQKLILSPALWNIIPTARDKELWKREGVFEEWLSNWRRRWFVPRHVYMAMADNRLLIDLENRAQCNELKRELLDRRTSSVRLEEAFITEKDLWIQGPGGRFVGEIVSMFMLTEKQAAAQRSPLEIVTTSDTRNVIDERRNRLPGTDCLYVKLYGGKNLEDELIGTPLLNVLNQFIEKGLIDSWFFIRYIDPDSHLRLRLFGDPHSLTSQVYPLICQFGDLLCKQQLRKKITIDTYEREVERYGGTKAIELAERLFAADSVFVAYIIQQERRGLWNEERSTTCAFTIDKLLGALGFDAEQRLTWYKPNTAPSKVAAGHIYRDKKEALSRLFVDGKLAVNPVLDAQLSQWHGKLAEIGSQYRQLEAQGSLTTAFPRICRSFVHMHCNRLGIDLQQEAIAVALAERACQAAKSRGRK